jgi:hypothetical protein
MSNSDVRGIFRIKQVYEEQLSGYWPTKKSLLFSYFVGGGPAPAPISTVERISYSNDTATASPRGPLSLARRDLSATGNTNFGYFGGGGPGPAVLSISTVDRIDYSNDTSIASVRNFLTIPTASLTAVGNDNFGYFAGGSIGPANTVISTIDRIDYSSETLQLSPRGPLSLARRALAATGNNDFGYFGGGITVSTVDRIDYSNDTAIASVRGPLSLARHSLSATGNANFGYFGGGLVPAAAPATPTPQSIVDRIDYSNDGIVAPTRGSLTLPKTGLAAAGNANFGYFGGGNNSPGTEIYSMVDRIDYSNDLGSASYRTNLSSNNTNLSAVSYQLQTIIFSKQFSNFGYFGGGNGGTSGPSTATISNVERVDYSNDTTTASPRGPLSLARSRLAATGNANFGYFGGGIVPALISTVDRIDYSNDTETASPRGPLSLARGNLAAAGNNDFGYFIGGLVPAAAPATPSPISTIDRIDYSNDLETASPRGLLNFSRLSLAATGNANFGYFGGGINSPGTIIYSAVERIEYANDLASGFQRGPLSFSISNLAATGNDNFGYFGGGGPGPAPSAISRIDRIDYSNDTATSSPRGPLTSTRANLAATGNTNFGYFGGGGPGPAASSISTIDRIDYSNDTATASPRGPLNVSSANLAATSETIGSTIAIPEIEQGPATSYGYFGGGSPAITTINRIDYSNDTETASPRGPLSLARNNSAATGNTNSGYFGGGVTVSTVDRIDYSNDTEISFAGGPLSIARSGLAATGNTNFGYFGGGGAPGPATYSTVDRIDYSNDLATASVRGPLTSTRANLAATGNTNFGYFGGGFTTFPSTTNRSTVDRIDYSSDNITASPRGNLSLARGNLAATGNANFGYFGGGNIPAPATYSTVDRIDYSNDTATASPRGPLSLDRFGLGATGNTDFGYFGGGGTPANRSTVDRINYSNDTATASPRGPLSLARSNLVATSAAENGLGIVIPDSPPIPISSTAYFGGGGSSIVDRIDYSNDESTTLRRANTERINTFGSAATGNANFGYFGGGGPSITTLRSQFERIDYSNDTATYSIGGGLSLNRRDLSATGNTNFGYFGGGQIAGPSTTPAVVSRVDRIDYSNDTSIASIRGPLNTNLHNSAATGNANFGYFGGGQVIAAPSAGRSLVNRIDYSNDLATASPRGNLSLARHNLAATGNNDFGYFGGGNVPAPAIYSRVDRIDYSNDTSIASIRGPLSLARFNLGATGNTDFGYFGGGGTPANRSTIDRIDYSNDTETASPRGPLSTARAGVNGISAARFS